MTTPHKNDMSAWESIGCTFGHRYHPTINIHDLPVGGHASYADQTPIPERFRRDLDIEVWDWRGYMDLDGYCPARDVVSQTIAELGVWEPAETTVMLLCMEPLNGEGWFIDMGCQIGWYSSIAASMGLNVLGIDADPECAALAFGNIGRNATGDPEGRFLDTSIIRLGVDEDPVLDPALINGQHVVAKIDVEGAEPEAVDALLPIIDSIDAMLIEISPVFHGRYVDLAFDLVKMGFEPYEIPPKHRPPTVLNELEDLRPFHLDRRSLNEIPVWHQSNVLFLRGGIS